MLSNMLSSTVTISKTRNTYMLLCGLVHYPKQCVLIQSGFYLEIIFGGEVDFQSCGLATYFINIRQIIKKRIVIIVYFDAFVFFNNLFLPVFHQFWEGRYCVWGRSFSPPPVDKPPVEIIVGLCDTDYFAHLLILMLHVHNLLCITCAYIIMYIYQVN